MEGAGSGRKRKVPNALPSEEGKEPDKSKKRKPQQVHSNHDLCIATVTTPKNKKKVPVPESSLGSDRDWLSPPKGNNIVVLALSADQSGEKKVERITSSPKTSKKKILDLKPKLELADKQKEVCVDLIDCYPLSQLLQEPKRKKRSGRGNKNVLVNNLSNPDSVGEKSDQLDGRTSNTDQIIAGVDPKVDVYTQEVLPNKSSEAVPSETKKKRRSSRENKLTLKNGINELPNALINNCSDQQSNGKIHTSSIAAEVGDKVDNDSTPQNQEVPIKKKRRSGQGKKLALESGASELPNALVNKNSDQDLVEEKSNLLDGKNSTKLIAAEVRHKVDGDTRKLQNQEAPVNTSSEAASRTADKYEEGHIVKSEIKKKRHSGQGKKLALESGAPKALVNNSSDQNLDEEKSNLSGSKISTSLIAAKVSPKADADSYELPNQEVPVNKSTEAASRAADEHGEVHIVQSEIKKKRRSGQVKKLVLASGANKLPSSLVNNHLDQSLMKEKSNFLDGKISTAQVAAEVSHKVDYDTCELQNQDTPVNKSSVAASRTADKHGEMNIIQSDTKKKRRSGQGKKLALESGSPKALVNNSLGQNLKEEKSNLSDGKISTSLIAANVSHKAEADTCALQNQAAPVDKSSEAASRKAEHEEVNMVQSEIKKKTRSVRGKKHMSESERNLLSNTLVSNHLDQHLMTEKSDIFDEKTTTTSPITGSEAKHKVDSFTLCEVQNKEVGVSKGLDDASQLSNTQEEGCETRQKRKRKEKKHIKEKMKPTSHQATASDNLSTLDVSAGRPDPSFAQGNITSSSGKCSMKDMASSNGDVRSDDKITETFIYDNHLKGSASPEPANTRQSPTKRKEKKHKKEKLKSTSHQAKAFDDLPSSDLSAEHPDSSFCKEVVAASLIKSPVKEVASSIGDVRSDDVIIETPIIDDNHLKGPASPERAHIHQFPKKLLILDLNGLLVDIVCVLPKGCKADKWVSRKALLKRPFCDDFLNFCFETFNVAVWSSRTKKNVDTVVDFIMGDKRHKLLFCWDQSHCTKTGFPTVENDDKAIVLKELRKVWNKGKPDLPWERGEYNESNTLLLDDSPYKALLNPRHTAIFPDSYDCRNQKDNALGPGGSLRIYLEGLATAENVQKHVEQNPFGQRAVTSRNPSWQYYLNVMKANRLRMPM